MYKLPHRQKKLIWKIVVIAKSWDGGARTWVSAFIYYNRLSTIIITIIIWWMRWAHGSSSWMTREDDMGGSKQIEDHGPWERVNTASLKIKSMRIKNKEVWLTRVSFSVSSRSIHISGVSLFIGVIFAVFNPVCTGTFTMWVLSASQVWLAHA